jgi:hypothetical protein
MYIPSTFFSSQGAALSISASNATFSGYFQSGSTLYGYLYWGGDQSESPSRLLSISGSLTIFSGSINSANVLIIGGGGGGANRNTSFGNTVNATGGGGAGGVVRYNNFTLTPGTYEVVAGGGGDSGVASVFPHTGSVGKNSYLKLPNNQIYTPFTSSFLTAFGGGGGGIATDPGGTGSRVNGPTGASNGGICQARSNNTPNVPPDNIGDGLGGLNGLNQGNSSGFLSADASSLLIRMENTSTGGGGASAASLPIESISGFPYFTNNGVSNGGDGLLLKIYPLDNGTSSYYAGGGASTGRPNGVNVISNPGLGALSADAGGTAYIIGGGGAGCTPVTANVTAGGTGCVYIEYPLIPSLFPNTMVSGGLTLWTSYNSLTGSSWYDISGNGNSGYVTGSTITVSNNSVLFNGINNSVWFTSSLNATPSSSMTLIWNGTFASSSINYDLFCKESFSTGWDTIFSYPQNKIVFRDNGGQDVEANSIYSPNEKAVFAMTITNGSQKIYKNGQEVAAGTSGFNGFSVSNFPLVFGFNENTDASWFSGSMSDVLVYNRILSSNEVLSVSNYLTQNTIRPTFTPVEPPIPSNGINIDYLLVGGGGGSAQYTGGGAGGYVSSSASFIFDSSSLYFDIIVGKSGSVTTDTQPTNGGNSSISSSLLFNSASGGGAGAYMNTINFFPQADGQVGGSGGGGLIRNIYTLNPGAGISPQGFSGGSAAGATPASGAGGGGAGAAGNNQNGGIGKLWVDGVYYAGGGYGNFRIGGNGSAGSGSFGRGGSAGGVVPNDGVVKVRYLGAQRGSGGTITQSGGYTYHTFTSNGTLRLDRF